MTHALKQHAKPHLTATLILACLAQFMVILDVSVVNVALPSMKHALDFTESGLQWVVNGYTVTFAGFLLLGGRAADLLGRRRVFVAGLVLFSLSSLAGGLADSRTILIAARLAQGLGRFMHASGISKIEQLDRRIDVDDLVALAVALDVSPNRLLLGAAADSTELELTPSAAYPADEAWLWALGAVPLGSLHPADNADMRSEDDRRERFARENRPTGPDMSFIASYLPATRRSEVAVLADVAQVMQVAISRGTAVDVLHKVVDLAAALASDQAS